MATRPTEYDTPKKRRFATLQPTAISNTQAAIDAGYSVRSARQSATKNMQKPSVGVAIAAIQQNAAEKAGVTAEWAFARLHENVERSLQAIPVLDREGNPTGEYRYEPAAVNKGVELAMRHLKLLDTEPVPTGDIYNTQIFAGYTAEELRAIVAEMRAKEQPDAT